MSVTSGVVSRVEMQEYSQAGRSLLALQIDAAINPGNSGGPVVDGNLDVVGVAFQSLNGQDVENIGYVVPVTVAQHFLEDIRRNAGRYTGWCELGIQFSPLENKQFRAYAGMKPRQTGVLVTGIGPTSAAFSRLQKDDVLLSVDGISIANDGSIPFRRGERVAMSYYISMRYAGDVLDLRVLRAGLELPITVPLRVGEELVPYHFGTAPPPYVIVAGLVFTALSVPYLEDIGAYDNFVNPETSYLVSLAEREPLRERGNEVVVLASVLCHRANLGYEHLANEHLVFFNGAAVTSVAHLDALLRANVAPFLRFEFGATGKVVVLDAAAAAAATHEVCDENAVPEPVRLRIPEAM